MSVQWILDMMKIDEYSVEEMGAVAHDTGWISEGKHEYRSVVYDMTGFHPSQTPEEWPPSDHDFEPGWYRVNESRSGSYWSDYEHNDPVVEAVVPYTETVTKYRKVK